METELGGGLKFVSDLKKKQKQTKKQTNSCCFGRDGGVDGNVEHVVIGVRIGESYWTNQLICYVNRHKDKRMVLAHMAKHTRRDNFSCGICGKGSNWQSVIRVFYTFSILNLEHSRSKLLRTVAGWGICLESVLPSRITDSRAGGILRHSLGCFFRCFGRFINLALCRSVSISIKNLFVD